MSETNYVAGTMSTTTFYFFRRSFFPPSVMPDSKEHVPRSFDDHLRYAQRRIGAIGAPFNLPQDCGPRDFDLWDHLLRHGAYGFCIHCLATSLTASFAPRELPPARIRLGIQVRARRIFPHFRC